MIEGVEIENGSCDSDHAPLKLWFDGCEKEACREVWMNLSPGVLFGFANAHEKHSFAFSASEYTLCICFGGKFGLFTSLCSAD